MPVYSGRVRSIVLLASDYEQHEDVIKQYLDGHKVETYIGRTTGWLHVVNPHFDEGMQYRIANEETQVLPGQKWRSKTTERFTVTVTGLGLGVVYFQDLHQYIHYCSVEEFYERYTRIS